MTKLLELFIQTKSTPTPLTAVNEESLQPAILGQTTENTNLANDLISI